MTIHELLIQKQAQYEGKPAQDILDLLFREEQEEGLNNDGLLYAYIKEAHALLEDVVLLLNEDILFERIKSGETVRVRVSRTGEIFKIRQHPDNSSGLPAYDALDVHERVRRNGLILGNEALRNWLYGLVED